MRHHRTHDESQRGTMKLGHQVCRKTSHRTHDEMHRSTMKAVQENRKSRLNLPSYHDMTHRGHDEAKLHTIVATMDTMGAQKSPEPS
ncbi:hypothetical protein L195_g057196 [Trifolium pratense]|uniref:Uncharacterized protein n=1 Tax=Trifolium pratense TaxID=57577 RepID=A0A2K3KVD3_TRIPR|nr:hypothetical protein L195_g057196 [Trifolium pratense]